MKKLATLLLTFVVLFAVVSCGDKAFDNIISQLDELAWQSSMVYENDQVNQTEESIRKAGIDIKGEVKSIAHFIKAEYPENTWVYVYEFETNEDAQLFKEKYADNWGTARIKDTVVVYGTATEAINGLDM